MTRCYAWPLTIAADEDLRLHVSTQLPSFGVRLFRYGATIEEVPGPAGRYDGRDLPLGRPDEAWGWPRYAIRIGWDLPDGIYLAVPVPAGEDGSIEPVEAGPQGSTFVNPASLSASTASAPIGRPRPGNWHANV